MRKKANYVLNVIFIVWSASALTVNEINAQGDSSATKRTTECNDWYFFNGFCYKIFLTEEYYKDAESICKASGSQLVSITNTFENNYVQTIIAKYATYGEVWIGLKRSRELFQWLDGRTANYENWLIAKPRGIGNCVRMMASGYWINLVCYHRLPFVCKREKNPPEGQGNLALILNIAIPLSCVFIMCIFVGFLCFRSHQELSDIQADNIDGKPFEIIQAAMILPIKKAPDLLNNNKGKNLWKGAIEKLKAEQIKNNPFNDPGNFLKRATSGEIVGDGNNNNDGKLNESADGGTLADIVNSMIRKRRETITTGMLGAPATYKIVPSISVNRMSVNLDSEPNNSSNSNNKQSRSLSISSNTSTASSNSFSDRTQKNISDDEEMSIENNKHDRLDTNENDPELHASKIDIFLTKKTSCTDNTDELYADNVESNSRRSSSSTITDDDSSTSESDESSPIYDKYRDFTNLVEVDVNKKTKPPACVIPQYSENKNINCPNSNVVKNKEADFTSRYVHLELIRSHLPEQSRECEDDDDSDGVFQSTAKSRRNDDDYARGVSFSSNSCGSFEGNHGVFDRHTFRESVRRESERRKEQYFPSTSSENCERDFSDVPLPPLIQQDFAADYTQVTLV